MIFKGMYFHSIIWDFRNHDLNSWTFLFFIWNTIAVCDSSYCSNANNSWIPTYSFHWSTEFYFSNCTLHISIWTSHCFLTSILFIMEFIIFSSLEINFPFLFLFVISLSSAPHCLKLQSSLILSSGFCRVEHHKVLLHISIHPFFFIQTSPILIQSILAAF